MCHLNQLQKKKVRQHTVYTIDRHCLPFHPQKLEDQIKSNEINYIIKKNKRKNLGIDGLFVKRFELQLS